MGSAGKIPPLLFIFMIMQTIIIDWIDTIQFRDGKKLSIIVAKVKGETEYKKYEMWDAEKFFKENFENGKVKFQQGKGRTTLKSLLKYIAENTGTSYTFFMDGIFSMEYRDDSECHTEIAKTEEEFLQLQSEGFCKKWNPNFESIVRYALI